MLEAKIGVLQGNLSPQSAAYYKSWIFRDRDIETLEAAPSLLGITRLDRQRNTDIRKKEKNHIFHILSVKRNTIERNGYNTHKQRQTEYQRRHLKTNHLNEEILVAQRKSGEIDYTQGRR
jgi:hypothetical protein